MSVKKSDRTSKKRRYTSPGGSRRLAYHKKKTVKLYCRACGKELLGVPTNMRGKSKSERVPNRPYAGVYCSSCTRKVIKEGVMNKIKQLGDAK